MPATTVLRTVSGVPDIRVELLSGTIMRSLNIGTDWSYIRIGMRYCMTPGLGQTLQGKKMFVGMCTGTLSGWNNGTATSQHAVGMFGPALSDRPYYLGALLSQYTPPNGWYDMWGWEMKKRIGTTATGTAVINYNASVPACDDSRTVLMLLDIDKNNNVTWNFRLFGTLQQASISPTLLPSVSITKDQFLAYMTIPVASLGSTPLVTGGPYNSTTGSLVVTQSADGFLDTVNVFSEIPIEISDIAVSRFS